MNININVDPTGEEELNSILPVDAPSHDGSEHKLTVVFTGHRAIDKVWCDDYTNMHGSPQWGAVAHALTKFGEWLLDHGYEPKDVLFVNGGALGFDLAAVYGLILPWQKLGAHYTLALPWPGYWNPKWNYRPNTANQIRHAYDRADTQIFAQSQDDGQWAKALNMRNEVMVNHLGDDDVLMGCWSGIQRGGTWNCLKYAQERRVGLFGSQFRILTVNPMTGKWGEL